MYSYSSIHFNSKGRTTTNASKPEILEQLQKIGGAENILIEPEKVEPYGADAVKEKFRKRWGKSALKFYRNNSKILWIMK